MSSATPTSKPPSTTGSRRPPDEHPAHLALQNPLRPATVLWSAFIVCLIVLPFPLRLRLAFGWGYTTIWLARLIVGIKWQIHGLDKMPQGACVLMVNHQSTWETAFLPNLKLRQVWVLKKELMMLPFFGWALAVLRPVPIDRKQKRQAMQKVIEEGRQRIESGYSVILFPEGTRAPADSPLPFKLGAARLACRPRRPGRTDRAQRRTILAETRPDASRHRARRRRRSHRPPRQNPGGNQRHRRNLD